MLENNHNSVKEVIQAGGSCLGAWVQSGSNIHAELLAEAGLDIVMIDMEHGPSDYQRLISQFQALKGTKAVPFVRAPGHDKIAIKKILDAGAYGILVPYVETAEQARAAVAAAKYPLHGIRGLAGSTRAANYGNNGLNYFRVANDEVMVIVSIESRKGWENLDEILQVEGIDVVTIGPYDFATSMGSLANPDTPEVQAALADIEDKILASDKALMNITRNWEIGKTKLEKGSQIIVCLSDTTSLTRLALETLDKFNSTVEEIKNDRRRA